MLKRTASESSNSSISEYYSSCSTTAEPIIQPLTNPSKRQQKIEKSLDNPIPASSKKAENSSINRSDSRALENDQATMQTSKKSSSSKKVFNPPFPLNEQKDNISGRDREDSINSLNRVTFGQSDYIAYQFLTRQLSIKKWIEQVLSISIGDDLGKELKDGVIQKTNIAVHRK